MFNVPSNITIPSTAFNNGNGVYSLQMPYPNGREMVVVMSDAQGFGSGGVSEVKKVGPSQGGSCNTKGPSK